MFWLWVLCQWWCYMEYIYTVGLREVQIYPQLGYVIMSIIPAWWSSQTGGKHAIVNTINGFQRRPRVFSIILIIHYYSLVIKHSFENFPLTVANSKPFFFFFFERENSKPVCWQVQWMSDIHPRKILSFLTILFPYKFNLLFLNEKRYVQNIFIILSQ